MNFHNFSTMAIIGPRYHPSLGWYIIVPGPLNSSVELIISPTQYYKSMGVNPPINHYNSYADYSQDYEDDYLLQPTQLSPAVDLSEIGEIQTSPLSSYVFLTPGIPLSASSQYQSGNALSSSISGFENIIYSSLMSPTLNPATPLILEIDSSPSNCLSNLSSDVSHANIPINSMISDLAATPLLSTKSHDENCVQSLICSNKSSLFNSSNPLDAPGIASLPVTSTDYFAKNFMQPTVFDYEMTAAFPKSSSSKNSVLPTVAYSSPSCEISSTKSSFTLAPSTSTKSSNSGHSIMLPFDPPLKTAYAESLIHSTTFDSKSVSSTFSKSLNFSKTFSSPIYKSTTSSSNFSNKKSEADDPTSEFD